MACSFLAQILHIVIFIILGYFSVTYAAGVGKVFIGTSENDTTALYSFNQVVGGSLPVFVLLFDNNTGDTLPSFTPSTQVQVNCATVSSKGGYSNATFGVGTVILSGTQPRGTTLPASALVPGRPVGVQCWGSGHAQFTPETSLSPAKLFQVTPVATVNVVDGVIATPNDGTTASGFFYIELSEPVQTANVTVSCYRDSTGLACPIQATVTSALVTTGQQRQRMSYTVPTTSSCQRQPTPVFCRGISQSGDQFRNATSEGARGLFIIDQGQAILQPKGTSIYGTELQAVLSINSTGAQATFYCTAQIVSTTAAGQAIANDGTCPLPTSPTTPAPNTTAVPTAGTTDNTVTADTNTATFGFSSDASVFTTAATVLVTSDATVGTDFTDSSAPATGTTTAATVSPTYNQTGTWFVEPSSVTFSGSTSTQPLVVSRASGSLIAGTELVLVKCCAPPQSNSDPRYINQTSSLLVATYLSANLPINYTAATPNDLLETETVIINPAYVEVSPCPCNLTASACDLNCCCDSDCSDADVMTFTCLPGVEGGYANEAIDEHLCVARPYPQPDWFSIMCVHIENSAFLGYYVYPRSAIRLSTDYTSNSTTYQPAYTYKDSSRSVNEGPSGYQTGVSVKTGIAMESVDDNYYVGGNLRMGLPQRTAGGYCVWPAPVRFLTETNSSCVYSASLANMCSTFVSPLNARLFAQSSLWSGATGPQVLTEQGVATLAYADVQYLCAGSSLAGYTKSLQTYADIVPRSNAVTFNVTVNNSTNCYFDSNTGAYLCGNQTLIGDLAGTSVAPSRCTFDNGYTMPPSPVFNATSGLCSNAVVDVLYNFTWRGQAIVALNATIILGNIPLVTTHTGSNGNVTAPTIVTPRYRSTFTYVSASNSSSDISINATTPSTAPVRQRSGNPGYTDSLPVHSGVLASLSANDSSQVYVNTSDLSRLAVWIPGNDGLCTYAKRGTVRFREDTVTQCAVLLNIDAMSDCYNLRRQILNQQDRMMPANYIAVFGDPDVTLIANVTSSAPHWLPIFRQDMSYLFPSNATSNQSGSTTLLPFTTGAPTTSGLYTTDLPIVNDTEPSGPAYITVAPGRCTDIPSGIHVDILYALAGTSNWGAIREIVGAKITYTTSTWSLKCASGAASSSCSSASPSASQPFYLTTSVNFIEVPASLPTGISRYDSERQNMSGVCQYDRCWSRLFYPFQSDFPGDSYDVTLGYSLSFLLVLISLFLITRPWW